MVAWLEAGAGEALDRGEAAAVRRGGSGARFARGEGVPRETRQRLEHPAATGVLAGAAKPDALVTELDPDAPTRWGLHESQPCLLHLCCLLPIQFLATGCLSGSMCYACHRQGRRWAESNAKDEERLMRHLFRLLRCGRLETARQLCHEVGQPWRAASLGSGGGLGLIPLGIAAHPGSMGMLTFSVHLGISQSLQRASAQGFAQAATAAGWCKK